jgi:hypothetical protein
VLAKAIAAVVSRPNPSMNELAAEPDRRAAETVAADLSRCGWWPRLAWRCSTNLPSLRLEGISRRRRVGGVLHRRLTLPTRDELSIEHRFRRLEFEKVFGRACSA